LNAATIQSILLLTDNMPLKKVALISLESIGKQMDVKEIEKRLCA
jgi:hypothetical protein